MIKYFGTTLSETIHAFKGEDLEEIGDDIVSELGGSFTTTPIITPQEGLNPPDKVKTQAGHKPIKAGKNSTSQPVTDDRPKAVVRIVVTIILAAAGIYLIVVPGSITEGVGLLAFIGGYWIS